MLTTNAAYLAKNTALAKQPVYVAELFFNGGATGVDGTNDIYFSTCDVNDITGFPFPAKWFPVLKANSIGSMSQQVDPINGVSTIGNVSMVVTDYKGIVSDIIKAADTAGHGLRRQRISIFKMFKGMAWADRVLVRTMQVQDLKLSALNEYTLSAADVQTQLKKTIFNPFQTTTNAAIAAAGAATFTVVDARNFKLATSVSYGASGFIKIDNEIMRWTVSATNSFSIAAPDRGLFGTIAAAHAIGAKVDEIIYLNENPITMMLKLMESSGVAGANGVYDTYPAHWGCGMDSTNDVQEADWLSVGQLLTGLSAANPMPADGLQFEFILNKGVSGKKFVEDSIHKILGSFGFVRGDGKYSIRAYNDIGNAIKENCAITLDRNNVVKWGDLNYNYQTLANQLWIDYDEQPKLSGKYIRSTLFVDSASVKKWGDAPQLKYVAQGVPPTSAFIDQLYQRFQRVLARYSRPPMQISLTLLPKLGELEIGDLVRVTLPIRDIFTGAPLDRAFEVLSTQLTPTTGEVVIQCIAQPEVASFWFQGVGAVASVAVSPNVVSIPTGGTQQLIARSFDATGAQVPTPAISWVASGNVTVDANGLITAGAVGTGSVAAIVGTKMSASVVITITASAITGTTGSVVIAPATVSLATAQTQQATALAKDIAGAQLNGKTFNWSSSNPAVATVPIGPSVSALITAVTNGSANITATETLSGIASAPVPVTVAAPVTPTYTPPAIADSAYKIGTQITTHGVAGGPHAIPNGYNFAAGDYWYDGNVTLPLGSTCTINGTVRIFSLGGVTIDGTVDGVGRGQSAALAVSGFIRNVSGQQGFVGSGGVTGGVSGTIPPPPGFRSAARDITQPIAAGFSALNQSAPILSLIGSSVPPWQSIQGMPSSLVGTNGWTGYVTWDDRSYNVSSIPAGYAGTAGTGGAGLLICARGLYISAGSIDLRGGAGGNATALSGVSSFAEAGSGGGGGSFVGLAERNAKGLPVLSVLQSRIITVGGAGGQSSRGSLSGSFTNPGIGGNGAFYAQVIG